MPKPSIHKILDKQLFEQLFKDHYVHLCNFASQYVQDMDSARDITQKVFINLWEKRESIDPQKKLLSYLFTSVRNRCLNHLRDQKKYRSRILDLEIVEDELAFEDNEADILDLQIQIADALRELPERCRQVFEMSRFKKMKYKDIAEELSISEKTVEAHMSKALKMLRENLKDYVYFLIVMFGW
jgi:RNA polymerase sigma-70 factor (ECF subfamily)